MAAERTRLNLWLHISNAALVLACVLATFGGTLRQSAAARANLKELHNDANKVVNPCGLAVPSTALLEAGVRHDAGAFDGIGDEQRVSEEIASGLCSSENVYVLLSFMMRNRSIYHKPDEDGSWTDAEASLLDAVCGDTDDTHGDIRARISRAYMGSHAAFVRFATGCSFESDPFAAATCTQRAVVKAEMLAAATDASAAGFGELPSTGKQLYRLAALATAGFFDRFVNAGRCTGVHTPTNATALCEKTFGDRHGAVGFDMSASPPPAAAGALVGYRNMVQQTCAERAADFNSPSPPPAPDWLTPQTGEMAACTDSLMWGLVDLRRGFGVPDAVDPFEFEVSSAFWLIRPFFKWCFRIDDARVSDAAMIDRAARLRLYAAYRLAAISAKSMVANSVAGFVGGFAAVPTGVFVLARVLDFYKPQTLIQPPMRSILPVAALVGFLYWAWCIWVDPEWHSSPYYVSISCARRNEAYASSAPWLTSDGGDRNESSWVPWLVLASVAYLFAYVNLMRKYGVTPQTLAENRNYTNPRHPFSSVIMVLCVVQLLFFVLQAVDTGRVWFELAATHVAAGGPALRMDELENYENDLYLAVVASLMFGFAVGVCQQRWAVATMNKAGKVPYGAALITPLVAPLALQWYVYGAKDLLGGTRRTFVYVNACLTAATASVALYFVKQLFDAFEEGSADQDAPLYGDEGGDIDTDAGAYRNNFSTAWLSDGTITRSKSRQLGFTLPIRFEG
jgi:hypothetical protein